MNNWPKDCGSFPMYLPYLISDRTWTRGDLFHRYLETKAQLSRHDFRGRLLGLSCTNPLELMANYLAVSAVGGISVLLPPQGNIAKLPLAGLWCQGSGLLDYTAAQAGSLPHSVDCLVLTSGSSGGPKAVALSWEQLMASALGTCDFYNIAPGRRWLLSLPCHHVGGFMILVRALLGGLCVQWGSGPKSMDDDLRRFQPDLVSLVPTQLHRLNDTSWNKLREAGGIVISGAGTSQELWLKIRQNQLPVSLSYGCSESCSQLTATPFGDLPTEPNNCGVVLPNRQLRIINGRISFAGKTRFSGYLQGQRFVTPFDDDGFFLSNDRGRWQENQLCYEGRNDIMFQCGGETINPHWIEAELGPLGEVDEYAVLADSHPDLGAIPCLVVCSPQRPDTQRILRELERLPKLYRPRKLYWYPQNLLRSPEGPLKPRAILQSLLNQRDKQLISLTLPVQGSQR